MEHNCSFQSIEIPMIAIYCSKMPCWLCVMNFLPSKVASQELKNKKDTHLKNFSASLMERLVDPNSVEAGQGMPKYDFVCLNTQSRMNPALLPLFEQDYAGADRHIPRSLNTRRAILPVILLVHIIPLANYNV